jgi:hypothetical protein
MPKSIDEIITDAAVRYGLDPQYMGTVAKIESGKKANAHDRGSSYHGLFQLGGREFATYGGRGNIYDPVENANSAAAMMADQRNAFTAKYGRPPTPTEAYMIHQQGAAGLDAHLANPDAPAWVNMYSTGEGQQKGPGWAKRAIWGNIPDYLKPQFGNVENVTSADFINKVWLPKVEGDSSPATGSPAGPPVQAGAEEVSGSPAGPPAQAGSTPTAAVAPRATPAPSSLADLTASSAPPSAANKGATGLGFKLPGAGDFQMPSSQQPTIKIAEIPAPPSAVYASNLLAKYGRR